MNDRKFRAILRINPDPPRSHRERLEKQLLAGYDAQARWPARRTRWLRQAPAIAVLLALLTASQVPASFPVVLGKRITVEFAGRATEASVKELVQALNLSTDEKTSGTDKVRSVDVQLSMRPNQTSIVILNAWGEQLPPDGAIVARLRALPQFSEATLSVTILEGKIHDNLAGLMRRLLFHRAGTPEERERARQDLIEELRRTEGSDAKVDVQLEDEEGRQEVRVKVVRPPQEDQSEQK